MKRFTYWLPGVQMYLAMVWNRVDIAEEKIFSNRELVWKEGELDMVMTKALLMEREAFVELLILNGFSMHKFLSVKVRRETMEGFIRDCDRQKLRDLYNEAAERHTHLLDQVKTCHNMSPNMISYQILSHSAILWIPLADVNPRLTSLSVRATTST